MSVAGQSQFRKHRSPRILPNQVRETPSIPVRRVRKDVLLDERHALLPSPTSKSYFRWGHRSQSRGCQHFLNSEDSFPHSSTLNTSFIERLNLTIRQSSAYLSRRTLSHARSTERLDEHLELLRCYYNFVRPHGALKFGREIRTLAMQAGLTTRRLTFRDIFLATTIPLWSRIEVFLLSRARNPVSSEPVPLPAAA